MQQSRLHTPQWTTLAGFEAISEASPGARLLGKTRSRVRLVGSRFRLLLAVRTCNFAAQGMGLRYENCVVKANRGFARVVAWCASQ